LQRRITKPLAALALVSAILLAPAAPAFAAPGGAITPGAFCSEKEQGTHAYSGNGKEYVCEEHGNDKRRWHPVNEAPAPPKNTTPANPGGAGPGKPDKPAGASKETVTKQPTTVEKTAQDSDSLPVTGDNTPYQVGGGLALLALGGGLVLVARRRRTTRFTA
jgi:LPXTG-motif cell wall-anchored protein